MRWLYYFATLFPLSIVVIIIWGVIRIVNNNRMYEEEKMRQKGVKRGFLITSRREQKYRKTKRHGAFKKSKEKKSFFSKWQIKVFIILFFTAFLIFIELHNEPVGFTVAVAILILSVIFLFSSTIYNIIF